MNDNQEAPKVESPVEKLKRQLAEKQAEKTALAAEKEAEEQALQAQLEAEESGAKTETLLSEREQAILSSKEYSTEAAGEKSEIEDKSEVIEKISADIELQKEEIAHLEAEMTEFEEVAEAARQSGMGDLVEDPGYLEKKTESMTRLTGAQETLSFMETQKTEAEARLLAAEAGVNEAEAKIEEIVPGHMADTTAEQMPARTALETEAENEGVERQKSEVGNSQDEANKEERARNILKSEEEEYFEYKPKNGAINISGFGEVPLDEIGKSEAEQILKVIKESANRNSLSPGIHNKSIRDALPQLLERGIIKIADLKELVGGTKPLESVINLPKSVLEELAKDPENKKSFLQLAKAKAEALRGPDGRDSRRAMMMAIDIGKLPLTQSEESEIMNYRPSVLDSTRDTFIKEIEVQKTGSPDNIEYLAYNSDMVERALEAGFFTKDQVVEWFSDFAKNSKRNGAYDRNVAKLIIRLKDTGAISSNEGDLMMGIQERVGTSTMENATAEEKKERESEEDEAYAEDKKVEDHKYNEGRIDRFYDEAKREDVFIDKQKYDKDFEEAKVIDQAINKEKFEKREKEEFISNLEKVDGLLDELLSGKDPNQKVNISVNRSGRIESFNASREEINQRLYSFQEINEPKEKELKSKLLANENEPRRLWNKAKLDEEKARLNSELSSVKQELQDNYDVYSKEFSAAGKLEDAYKELSYEINMTASRKSIDFKDVFNKTETLGSFVVKAKQAIVKARNSI